MVGTEPSSLIGSHKKQEGPWESVSFESSDVWNRQVLPEAGLISSANKVPAKQPCFDTPCSPFRPRPLQIQPFALLRSVVSSLSA